jgi:acetylserotonin O-methyltransferase
MKKMVNNSIGPEKIMEMATGFWVSKTLFAGIELRIFDALADGPQQVAELANKLSLPADSVERLLGALTAIGLLEKHDERFSNTAVAQSFLVKGSPTYLGETLEHFFNRVLYQLWGNLADGVRENSHRWHQAFKLPGENPFEAIYSDAAQLNVFLSAMSTLTAMPNAEMLADFDLSGYQCLMDVGGALGSLMVAALTRNQNLKGIVFDLPPVTPLTEKYIAQHNLSDRVEVVAGDMFVGPLPQNADIISLGWILHDWDDEHCVTLLKQCFAALPSGGTLLVLEKVLDESKTGPLWPALLSLTMLVFTLGGRERTAKEYLALLSQAGFEQAEVHTLPGTRDYIVARKP